MSVDDLIDKHFRAKPAKATPTRVPPKKVESPSSSAPSAAPAPAPALRLVESIADTEAGQQLQALLAQKDPPPPPKPELRLPVGLHLDVSHEDYCADPAERPSLSSSIAAILASRAALHGWYAHPRLGAGVRPNPTPSTGRGSILHKLLLGKGQEIVVVDAPDFKKQSARDERDAALAAGKIPVPAPKFEEFEAVAEVLRRRMSARGIALAGQSEVTGIWERDGLLFRLRADHLTVTDEVVIDDVKTCRDASPEKAARDMCEYADDVQHAAYLEGIAALIPEMAGRIRMRFVFCEADPPHDVVVIEPTGEMREFGERRWKRGKEIWRRCLEAYGEKTEWPGYSATPVRVGPPAYAVSRDSETQQNRMENSNDKLPF